MIESAEEALAGQAAVTRVDIYKSDGIARRLGVQEVPAVVYIRDNQIQQVLSGDITLDKIKAMVK